MTGRPGGAVLTWCAVYTLTVPPGERARRREEMASHVWEAVAAHQGLRSRLRLGLACCRGAADDLLWCEQVRRRSGEQSLLVEALIGRVGATISAGFAITLSYLLSLSASVVCQSLHRATAAFAVAVTLVSVGERVRLRFPRRYP